MRNGSEFNAYIENSPGPTVRIVRYGRQNEIPRSEIDDVAHPGTAAMIVGAAMVGAGVLSLVASRSRECDPADRQDSCGEQQSMREAGGLIALTVFAVPGLAVGAWGTATHLGSRARFAESGPESSR